MQMQMQDAMRSPEAADIGDPGRDFYYVSPGGDPAFYLPVVCTMP